MPAIHAYVNSKFLNRREKVGSIHIEDELALIADEMRRLVATEFRIKISNIDFSAHPAIYNSSNTADFALEVVFNEDAEAIKKLHLTKSQYQVLAFTMHRKLKELLKSFKMTCSVAIMPGRNGVFIN